MHTIYSKIFKRRFEQPTRSEWTCCYTFQVALALCSWQLWLFVNVLIRLRTSKKIETTNNGCMKAKERNCKWMLTICAHIHLIIDFLYNHFPFSFVFPQIENKLKEWTTYVRSCLHICFQHFFVIKIGVFCKNLFRNLNVRLVMQRSSSRYFILVMSFYYKKGWKSSTSWFFFKSRTTFYSRRFTNIIFIGRNSKPVLK